MKVGMFLAGFSPEAGGGYTIQDDIYRALVESADESQHEFVVFCDTRLDATQLPQTKRLQVVAYPRAGFGERLLERGNREFAAFRLLWHRPSRLDRLARQWGVEFLWFVSVVPQATDLPYLTMVWDLQHRLQPWFPEVCTRGIWDRRESYHGWFLQRATWIVAGTEAGRQEIERFYQIPPERIRLLPHPTPQFALRAPEHTGKQILERYHIPEGFLLYPAQFWAHKNHANLLLAVQELRDEFHLTLPVVFIGSDQGNLPYIRQLVSRLGLADQVRFLGFVPQPDLVALYRNAFALTYVTLFGPENLPPLEAFALGCPVVASNVPGASEQLGDAALLVDPTRPEQIARAILSLRDERNLRAQLVQRGLARAAKWTGYDFVRGVFALLDEFAPIRRCWQA